MIIASTSVLVRNRIRPSPVEPALSAVEGGRRKTGCNARPSQNRARSAELDLSPDRGPSRAGPPRCRPARGFCRTFAAGT